MQLINCRSCGRLLAKGTYISLEIKCSRCKSINSLSVQNAPLDCLEQLSECHNDKPKPKSPR
ncbi:Com family DNA-binding transcriptional regulator [Acinetobacter vivianii]|uniref:Com family DNA-binding transcriptional regulator n=1 Tax=Acinetobacter vivianii TaxID=1776742 RepID=UPI0009D6CF57